MLTPKEISDMQFTALSDQFTGHLRDCSKILEEINSRPSETWTPDEEAMIHGAVAGLLGMLYAGKL